MTLDDGADAPKHVEEVTAEPCVASQINVHLVKMFGCPFSGVNQSLPCAEIFGLYFTFGSIQTGLTHLHNRDTHLSVCSKEVKGVC
jgi:hypothetical protein